jgi:hypothetical protein
VLVLVVGTLAFDTVVVAAAAVGGPVGATPVSRAMVATRHYGAFIDPRPVDIEGYSGSAMEPFITPDGRTLLFNTSNVAPNIPSLQYASRAAAGTFDYRGPISGANLAGYLSGTPTVDREGELYFVSTRSYARTGSTIYSGRFSAGRLRGVTRTLLKKAGRSLPATVTRRAGRPPDPDGGVRNGPSRPAVSAGQ